MNTCYFIDKMSGTSADTLLAIGFASFLGDLSLKEHETQDGILLQDAGPYYTISSPLPIDCEHISDDDLQSLQIVLPLDSSRQREKREKKGEKSTLDGFDYDQQMDISRIYREQSKKIGSAFQTPEARLRNAPELADLQPPDTRLEHYHSIIVMKITGSFNELALRWDNLLPLQKRLHIDLLLRLFGNPLNDIPSAVGEWQKFAKELTIKGSAMVTALQIINPTTGKGANRAKASTLTIGNQENFWLLELLKFRGFMEGTAQLIVKESDNRKTYTIQPKQITLTLLQGMMKQFRAVFWPTTAVKLDILASLRFAQVIVEHYKTLYKQDPLLESWMHQEPVSLVPGFDVTFYKFLGSAHATMNISTIGLPAWLPRLESSEQVKVAEDLLDEHVQLIRSLRNAKGEEGTEEYELLRLYRDFLSGDDLAPFWEFTTTYSSYLMSAREKNRYVQLFTTQGLENLIMNNQHDAAKLAPISENAGFKHIANAIRLSTITAQYRRSQLDDRTYETHYGLGQELKRKAHRPAEFMEALGLFLQRYSEETEREDEKASARIGHKELTSEYKRTNHLRANISENDLKDIEALIDQHGSGLICSMLIAHGYARHSKDNEA